MTITATKLKDYGIWKELLPCDNYITNGDTMWSAKLNSNFTVEKGMVSMKLPTISFYAFGNDIIGGNFYGSNYVVTMKIKEFNKPVFDYEASGQKTIILNTNTTMGTLYTLEMELKQLSPSDKAVINHYVVFGVKNSTGWKEIFPEDL
jgi:hypothetical protein